MLIRTYIIILKVITFFFLNKSILVRVLYNKILCRRQTDVSHVLYGVSYSDLVYACPPVLNQTFLGLCYPVAVIKMTDSMSS